MNKKKIIDLLNNRINETNMYDWGDPSQMDAYWRDLSNEFKGIGEDEVIEFLDSLEDKQLEYISEIGEELFDIFEDSKTFHIRMYNLQEKRQVDMCINPPE